ncbi:MAG: alpha/beta hydrolase [Alphaproteobacteria bacterium]|nr:alpha/beta hydrolase [Alphaproteobacteria bacterium]
MIRRKRAMLLAVFLCSLASGCESLIAAEAERRFPVEGQMVDVGGGRQIQIDCRGAGAPTVVFQSGGDMIGSLAWAPVHDRIAEGARTCAYSRAGILWSDPDEGQFMPEDVARDLHAALGAAGERPPYVLVAHSRGGLYNLIFAGLYGEEIAGLVFADASHPDQEAYLSFAGHSTGGYVSAGQEVALALKWTGLMRLSPYPADPSIADRVRAFYPKSAQANAREARRRGETLAVAGKYRDLRNWPVVVLARELPEQTRARENLDARNAYLLARDGRDPDLIDAPEDEIVWRRLQANLSTWSSRGRLEIVPNSNHAFFFFRPDVIVDAVNEVLAATRVVRREAPPAG